MEPEGSRIQDDPHVKVMMAGSTLRRVKSRSWKKQRHFRLLDDGQTIWYKSRRAGKGHSTFSISELEAVREGHRSEVLLSIAEEFPADLCFTLVFYDHQGNLDLVADSPEEARAWIQGVRKLIHKTQTKLEQWVWDWFEKADKNKDGKMTFKEVRKLLKMINVDINKEHALHFFKMADKSDSGSLEIEQFVLFCKMLTQTDEVWKVFQDYSGDGEKLTLEELENFLKIEQREGEQSVQHAPELIDRYEPSEPGIQDESHVKVMMTGSTLRKVKSRSWKKQRHFRLLDDGQTIRYKSRRAGRGHSTFSISELEAVREGHQSEVLLSIAEEFPADLCFTLVFHSRQCNLDLVATSPEEARAWIQGVRKLIHKTQTMDEKERLDQWVRDWFRKADKNKDGKMTFKEVRILLKMMNVEMNKERALHFFKMADESDSSSLEIEEFVLFYKMLTQRDEVQKVFKKYSGNGEKLMLEELENFLKIEQREGEQSVQHAPELIDRYEPSESAKKQGAMSFDGFQMYLCSQEGSIFKPEHRELHQDMSQPLSHYFISSSHNTYLLEDQLRGQSSLEAYIQALKRGCRCVEVDCWEGSDGEPIVYHGHTLTSKILFRDVVSTLKEYAFKTSDFPVILSLENHCGVEQQTVMARHLSQILGNTLLSTPLDGTIPQQLPSPQELKGKILLKAKKIGGLEVCPDETLTDEVSDDEETPNDEAESVSPAELSNHNAKKSKLSRELSDLVVYCKSVHFCDFEHARSQGKCYEMSSFSESKAKKLAKEAGADFVQYNSRQLSRIYPSGLRADSSNYNPQEMWSVGCQIVALNFQTAGLEMDLNDGLFRQNGRCGFVLKPDFMRDGNTRFSPEKPEERQGHKPRRLSIEVISGQQLPKVNQKESSIVDPLVRVEIYGVPQDQTKAETKHINNNGFNPVWDQTLNFDIHAPELALVRFVVEDYDKGSKNDFMGQFTLPFTCIQPGYRHIHLLSRDGTAIPPSSLFVNISISERT